MPNGEWLVVPFRKKPKRKRIDDEMNVAETSSTTATLAGTSSTAPVGNVTVALDQLEQLTNIIMKVVNDTSVKKASPSIPLQMGNEMVPIFNPEQRDHDIIKWLTKIEELKVMYNWSELVTIHNATTRLGGLAAKWYQCIPSVNRNWEEWKKEFMSAFPVQENYAQRLEEMLKRVKRRDETMIQYFYDKLSLLNLCEIYGIKAVSCIISGIPDSHLQAAAKANNPQSPEQLLRFLKSLGDEAPSRKKEFQDSRPATRQPRQENFDNRKCYVCGSKDHLIAECPKKGVRCEQCKRYHSGECGKQMPRQQGPLSHPSRVMNINTDSQGMKFYVECKLNGVILNGYIDLGSACNIMKEEVLSLIRLEHDGVSRKVNGYGGGVVRTLGRVQNVILEVDQVKATTEFLVVANSTQETQILIGQPFTEQRHIVMLKDFESLKFYESSLIELPQAVEVNRNKISLRAIKTVVVPPRHIGNIVCRIEDKGDFLVESSVRLQEGNEYCVPRCIVRANENGKCCIPVINPGGRSITVSNTETFVRADQVENGGGFPETNEEFELKNIDIEDSLNEEEKQKLRSLIVKYQQCFGTTLRTLGCTNCAELNIDLVDEKPVVYRPYRLSLGDRDKVREVIDELMENQIIRESTSPYASPILLIQKKNGEPRLCIDYRKLNEKVRQDRFPLPRMDDQFDFLRGHKYFSTLDLTSGYYQIPVEEKSKYKTAFITPDGHYEFNRMPFGICTAPAVFQRMVNKVLGPLRGTIAVAYLDDIIVPSREFSTGLESLEAIFQVFNQHNLTFNPKKCHLFKRKIHYLGFEVDQEGIKPGCEKVNSLVNYPAPINVHQLRQFLGLVGFFRQFIKNYAILAKPLTKLLKKDVEWLWEKMEQKAFDTLRHKLIDRPVLAIYSANLETQVHCDASKLGVAGILMQKAEDNKFHPVAYYSRQTTAHEANYHSYELETLAVVESVKKFRVYLLDITFVVVTDCSAIKAAATKKDIIPRIARWWLTLLEFTFSVEYRPGLKMTHADALSRNPTKQKYSRLEVFRIETADWVLANQLTDDKVKDVNEILERKPTTDYERKVHAEFVCREGRVYKKTPTGLKWLVPKGMRAEIIRKAHDEFGHFGVEKTLHKICEDYWFAGMRKGVEKYIKSCIPCLYHKQPRGKRQGLMNPIGKGRLPFETVHLDHLGPFIKTTTGKKFIIVCVEAFTKFTLLYATKDTKTQPVINFLEQIIGVYGVPARIVTDRGTCYTSKLFEKYCDQRGIQHILNAVSTPRANGQVERFNSTVLAALATSVEEDNKWDKKLMTVQFAINNTIHKTTRKTPSELLMGFTPRSSNDGQLSALVRIPANQKRDLAKVRKDVEIRTTMAQEKQKKQFDKSRRVAVKLKPGELVLARKPTFAEGQSRKLLPKYKGPFKIKKCLPNDRYVVTELPGSWRSRRAPYENIEAVDNLKRWNNREAELVSESEEETETLIEDTQ